MGKHQQSRVTKSGFFCCFKAKPSHPKPHENSHPKGPQITVSKGKGLDLSDLDSETSEIQLETKRRGPIGDHTVIRGIPWKKLKRMLNGHDTKADGEELTDATVVAGTKWSSLKHTVMDPDYGHNYFFVS